MILDSHTLAYMSMGTVGEIFMVTLTKVQLTHKPLCLMQIHSLFDEHARRPHFNGAEIP